MLDKLLMICEDKNYTHAYNTTALNPIMHLISAEQVFQAYCLSFLGDFAKSSEELKCPCRRLFTWVCLVFATFFL